MLMRKQFMQHITPYLARLQTHVWCIQENGLSDAARESQDMNVNAATMWRNALNKDSRQTCWVGTLVGHLG